jgi:hypothetical protein
MMSILTRPFIVFPTLATATRLVNAAMTNSRGKQKETFENLEMLEELKERVENVLNDDSD